MQSTVPSAARSAAAVGCKPGMMGMAAVRFTNCTCAVLEKSSSSKPSLLMLEELCCREQPKAAAGGFAVREQ